MQSNIRITIEPVENGFIVMDCYDDARGYRPSEKCVFQSMQELQIFITEHFSHRCSELHEDAINSSEEDI
jgi:hypothetical protein